MGITHYTILFFVLTLLTVACSSKTDEFDPEGDEYRSPVREAFQVRFVFSEMAVVKATLEAPHVIEDIIGELNVQIFDRGVKMVFFDEDGEEQSTLTADSSIFTNKFEQAEFWRNVMITNIGGERIEAKRMHYDRRDSVPAIWAPLEVTPPQPIYRVRHELLNSSELPLAISRNFNQKFAGKPDSTVIRSVRNDIDSLSAITEKTKGDSMLIRILKNAVDTAYTSPELNQVVVETDKELLYGDSLWAKADFSRYRIYKISGAVELDEGL